MTPGGWREIVGVEVYKGGQWRRIVRAEVYKNGQWRVVANFTPSVSVSITPNPVTGAIRPTTIVAGYVTSNTATASIVGGEAPFSYAWSLVSGSVVIFTPTSSTTQFGAMVEPFDAIQAVAKVTVTDANGTVATATVNITLRNQPTV